MKWILIVMSIYMPPIFILLLWKKKSNDKYLYSSIYVITSCMIVLTLTSSAQKIDSLQEYKEKRNVKIQALEKKCINIKEEKKEEKKDKKKEDENKEEEEKENKKIEIIKADKKAKEVLPMKEIKENQPIQEENKEEENEQLEKVIEFKNTLYDIEVEALMPLRKAYKVVKKIQKGEESIETLYEEVAYAKERCQVVEKKYKDLEIPDIREENKPLLYDAKNDLQKAYYLRGRAMANGLAFLEEKNPKYLLKFKEELTTADKLIRSCVEKINKVKSKVEKEINE